MIKLMDGTDFKGQKLQSYIMGRKTGMRRYLKLFTGILTVSSYSAAATTKSSPRVYITDLVPTSPPRAGKPAINSQPEGLFKTFPLNKPATDKMPRIQRRSACTLLC
jgi:hypothetical protein